VRENLGDSSLDIEHIAKGVRLSPRYIHSLFFRRADHLDEVALGANGSTAATASLPTPRSASEPSARSHTAGASTTSRTSAARFAIDSAHHRAS